MAVLRAGRGFRAASIHRAGRGGSRRCLTTCKYWLTVSHDLRKGTGVPQRSHAAAGVRAAALRSAGGGDTGARAAGQPAGSVAASAGAEGGRLGGRPRGGHAARLLHRPRGAWRAAPLARPVLGRGARVIQKRGRAGAQRAREEENVNKTIGIAPVRKSVLVAGTPQQAFEVFTAGLDRWWPKGVGIGKTPLVHSRLEP